MVGSQEGGDSGGGQREDRRRPWARSQSDWTRTGQPVSLPPSSPAQAERENGRPQKPGRSLARAAPRRAVCFALCLAGLALADGEHLVRALQVDASFGPASRGRERDGSSATLPSPTPAPAFTPYASTVKVSCGGAIAKGNRSR